MTVTDPRVSTEVRVLIRAFFRAIRWLPMASARVTVGRRPSGTLATMMPMAKIKFPQKSRPMKWPMPKKITPVIVAMAAMSRVTLTISFWRGESPASTVPVNRAIFPNSVRIPVAKTAALPEPLTTVVPAKAMFGLSISSPGAGSSLRRIGSDSPVRGALLTVREAEARRRASAGTRSPSVNRITSPGTTSRAGSSRSFPSRTTLTRKGRSRRRASTDFSARYSWMKVKIALMTMTPIIASPRVNIPSPGWRYSDRRASPAPIQRRMARKWVNWRANFKAREVLRSSRISLGPNSRRRRPASSSVSPSSQVTRVRRTSSRLSALTFMARPQDDQVARGFPQDLLHRVPPED